MKGQDAMKKIELRKRNISDCWGRCVCSSHEPSVAEVIQWLRERDGIDYEAGRQVLATFQGVHPDRCQGLADAVVDAALGGEQ